MTGLIIDLFAGARPWGTACQWCTDDPHDCEECLGVLTPAARKGREQPLVAALMAAEGGR